VGTSWRVDETYIKLKGKWVYLYRGVDTEGQTIDFFLSEQRNSAAAKRFLPQAIEKRDLPQKITLDGYTAAVPGQLAGGTSSVPTESSEESEVVDLHGVGCTAADAAS